MLLPSQILMLILMIIGNVPFMTCATLIVRRFVYRRMYRKVKLKPGFEHLDVEDNIEYMALGKLATIIAAYIVTILFFTFLVLGLFCAHDLASRRVLGNDGSFNPERIDPWWFALFHAVTGFANGTIIYHAWWFVALASCALCLLVVCKLISPCYCNPPPSVVAHAH